MLPRRSVHTTAWARDCKSPSWFSLVVLAKACQKLALVCCCCCGCAIIVPPPDSDFIRRDSFIGPVASSVLSLGDGSPRHCCCWSCKLWYCTTSTPPRDSVSLGPCFSDLTRVKTLSAPLAPDKKLSASSAAFLRQDSCRLAITGDELRAWASHRRRPSFLSSLLHLRASLPSHIPKRLVTSLWPLPRGQIKGHNGDQGWSPNFGLCPGTGSLAHGTPAGYLVLASAQGQIQGTRGQGWLPRFGLCPAARSRGTREHG